MQQYFLAFVTGLTTGGLSCLAVQGGLLASSLAHQVEQDVMVARVKKGKRTPHPKTALPIGLFLLSKLVIYTLLGFFLGLLGSVLTLNATVRAILLIGIGIFMVGNALRMFNVHPIFRFFAIEPPKFITRYIRRKAKNSTDWFSPLFLGALTVFIPCGVTQAMMAVALATGSPLQGAALMFAFILGTSPVFFFVAYLTMQLGARLEKWFMRFVAIILLVLGLVSVNSGLGLVGSPLAVSNIVRNYQQASNALASQQGGTGSAPQISSSALTLTAANNGYFPQRLFAKAGEVVTLDIVTDRVSSCSRDFVIPALGYEQLLPASGSVTVSIPAQPSGTVMRFTCSMGMYTGEIVFGE
jgi:sulfite exporter TauE/SafE